MLSHGELIAALTQLKEDGTTSNAELARLLGLPSSRIAEIFSGKRQVRVDEMKAIVGEFDLDRVGAPPLSVDTLEPMLDAVLPLAPPGRMTDQSRKAVAEALAYGLALLGGRSATSTNADAIAVAARAAAARFRETATA